MNPDEVKIAPVADATQDTVDKTVDVDISLAEPMTPLSEEQKNPTGYVEVKDLPAPTVGRVVYYRDETGVDRAAIITEVNPAMDEPGAVDHVSLFVMYPHNFVFVQNISRAEEKGHWDWMPFQKGVKR